MANTDYEQHGAASFAMYVKTDKAYDYLDATVEYTVFNFAGFAGLESGMAAMWDDEIVLIDTVGTFTFTVKRGCADTLPQRHAPGAIMWIIGTATVGSDQVERSAGETVSVKVTPFTIGGGTLPIQYAPPAALTFNWRYFRPYNAAHLFVNAERWHVGAVLSDATTGMNLTWRDRNRVVQADKLLGHDDAAMAVEPGTTYTLEVYTKAGVLKRLEYGISGNAFLYQHAKALHDFGGAAEGFARFYSDRQETHSMQAYTISMQVLASASPIPSQWQAFDQRAIIAPYLMTARAALPPGIAAADHVLAFGVRPADRMSDAFNLYRHWTEQVATGATDGNGNPIYQTEHHHDLIGTAEYAPWVSINFRLPELETTLNVRTSSLYDGVRVTPAMYGKLALIDDELVAVYAINPDGTMTIGRGIGDTIPAVHVAGSRMYIFENSSVLTSTLRSGAEDYRVQPGVYGPAVNVDTLPALNVNVTGRGIRPYNVAQLQINARPWFEEVQAVNGAATRFSWAWRNRLTQGMLALDHGKPTVDPEAGTQCRLIFYYETPPTVPGEAPVQHALRLVDISPVAGVDGVYAYPYALAQVDGNAAGRALGICGTVVIYCAIECVRDGLTSLQRYVAPIRVPSHPCV